MMSITPCTIVVARVINTMMNSFVSVSEVSSFLCQLHGHSLAPSMANPVVKAKKTRKPRTKRIRAEQEPLIDLTLLKMTRTFKTAQNILDGRQRQVDPNQFDVSDLLPMGTFQSLDAVVDWATTKVTSSSFPRFFVPLQFVTCYIVPVEGS